MKMKRSLSLHFKFIGCFLKREEIVKCLWSCVFCKLNRAKFKFQDMVKTKKVFGDQREVLLRPEMNLHFGN
jgi:hypothetical protein